MVSVFVPAYNEEARLEHTVMNIVKCAAAAGNVPVEVIIVNDGSTDRTADLVVRLEKQLPFVRGLNQPRNLGIGAGFVAALKMAKYDKMAIVPGDGVMSDHMMTTMFKYAGQADIVAAYIMNTEERSFLRLALSHIYTLIYVLTFRVHLKYIHSGPVFSVPRLRALKLHSKRYGLLSEVNIKLLRSGATFIEAGSYINPPSSSSALKVHNLTEVVVAYVRLIWEVYFKERRFYRFHGTRVIPEEDTRVAEIKVARRA